MAKLDGRYLPQYGFLARAHDAAVTNGTLSGLDVSKDERFPI